MRLGISRDRPLRVAMLSTPFVSVPPPQYGGTELVVAELIDGLTELGAKVTLFSTGDATGGFRTRCETRALFEQPIWPPSAYSELQHSLYAWRQLLAENDEGFDVVHCHVPTFLPLSELLGPPVVYTVHHPHDSELARLYRSLPDVTYVCISARQLELTGPLERTAVVPHGIDAERYRLGPGGPAVAFLGRLAECKAPHVAIDVARRAGLPIRVAGRPHEEDQRYFEREVRPRLTQRHVEYLGELGHRPKVELLSTSRALLFPIAWEEPFGLVVIEAMLCGCPVIAFARGAVPELIEEGVTGFVARDEDHMVKLLRGAASPERFDRARCREAAARRFGSRAMVERYLEVYAAAADQPRASRLAPELSEDTARVH